MSNRSICFFDLDGTLDLNNPKLSAEIVKMSKMGVDFVTATGRTNSYVLEIFRKNNIIPPKFIIADNGGSIYDCTQKKYIKRTYLPIDIRKMIIGEYVRIGGRVENIRYTDGNYVYAAENNEVRKYYEKEKSILYRPNPEILNTIFDSTEDITKLTLAGQESLMKEIIRYIEEHDLKCWTDMGTTKFPRKERNNFRLDITDGKTSKGEAVQFLTDFTGIYDFTCIGNGPNDLSMFDYALRCNMPVIVVVNKDKGRISEESEALIRQVVEDSKKYGSEDKVIIEHYPINGFVINLADRKTSRERRRTFADTLRIKEIRKTTKIVRTSENLIKRVQHRGEEK